MNKRELIGSRIRTMRMSRKMTQADLAKAINQSQSSITMYETGRREPDFETLEALADVFNVPLASIVADASEPIDDQPKIRIVSGMMEKMSEEQQDQVVNVLKAMFSNHPELLK